MPLLTLEWDGGAESVGYTAVTPIGKLQPANRTAAVFTPIPRQHNNLFNTRKHTFTHYQQLLTASPLGGERARERDHPQSCQAYVHVLRWSSSYLIFKCYF